MGELEATRVLSAVCCRFAIPSPQPPAPTLRCFCPYLLCSLLLFSSPQPPSLPRLRPDIARTQPSLPAPRAWAEAGVTVRKM